MANFGERLRFMRENKKMTQKDISKKFKLAESTISMYERGEREPSLDLVEQFADFFNVSIDYLSGRSDSPVEYTTSEKSFLDDLQLTDDELINKYKLIVDGKEASEEEIKNAIKYIKALRLMQTDKN